MLYYRNPMGLQDTSPVPKKDSMGMDYVPVYADEAAPPTGYRRIALRITAAAITGSGPNLSGTLTKPNTNEARGINA